MPTDRRRSMHVLGLSLIGWSLLTAPAMAAPAPVQRAPATQANADYELAWKAFLAAGKLDRAVALAHKVLQSQPRSVLWHRRLASAAEQNGDAVLAARTYAWLASDGRQYQLLPRAIQLAIGTQQDGDAIRLMQLRAEHQPFDQAHWLQLIDAMLNAGRFRPLLDTLHRANHHHPRRFFLTQEARVHHILSQPRRQASVLRQLIRRYGGSPEVNLQLATLQFIDDRLHASLRTLKQVQEQAPGNDARYWQTLASLAWMVQDVPTSAHAGAMLVRSGQAKLSDYDRLFQGFVGKRPAVAYAYALVGWQQLRSPVLFFDALTAVEQMNAPPLTRLVFSTVRKEDLGALGTHPSFWTAWADQAEQLGHMTLARYRYLQALRRAPDDSNAEAGFLWLLIDSDDVRSLTTLVDRLGRERPRSPAVRDALAAAQARLGRPTRALALMTPERRHHTGDAAWLMQYADLLDQVGRADAAHAARLAAARALAHLHVAPANAADEAAQRLAHHKLAQELAQSLAPGDPARLTTAALLAHHPAATVRNQVLSWSMALDQPQAARLWLHLAYGHTPAPLWARLGQALARSDDSSAMNLLEHERQRLPRHDRVDAARRLGWQPLAASMAFESLSAEPDDASLAHEYRDLVVARSDTIGGEVTGLRTSGVTRLDARTDARLWLDHQWTLHANVHIMHQFRHDPEQIGTIPSLARAGVMTLTQHLPRTTRGVRIGGGHDLAGYRQFGAFYNYRLTRYTDIGARADTGVPTDDTMPLAIAGLADRVDLTINDRLSALDSVSARAGLARLRAQGGGQLGHRQTLELEYRHSIWLAPPSITLIASASDAHYQRASTLPFQLRPMLPPGGPDSTAFFVPRSYAQACVGAGYNAGVDQDWQPRVRLFGTASLCRNSVAGRGASATGGLVTPLIGHDRLSLALGYANDTGASASRTLNATLSYRYYFNP